MKTSLAFSIGLSACVALGVGIALSVGPVSKKPETALLADSTPRSLSSHPGAGAVLDSGQQGCSASKGTTKNGSPRFCFNLASPTTTSAGVFDASGNLLRTLWRRVRYLPGVHSSSWDGKDDSGNYILANGTTYTVKVLAHDIHYVWEGVISNTSASWYGHDIWHSGTNDIQAVALTDTQMFVSMGYNEGNAGLRKAALSALQVPSDVLPYRLFVQFGSLASDGSKVYIANQSSGWDPNNSVYVTAFNVSDNSQYAFPTGSDVIPEDYLTWHGVIDLKQKLGGHDYDFTAANAATGIAVQKTGNLLAVAHGPLNTVKFFDKVSGAYLGKAKITNPQGLAFSKDGDLWVLTGTQVTRLTDLTHTNSVVRTLSGFAAPLSIAASPSDDALVYVADGGTSQQIKRYAGSTPQWTLGQSGGYRTNGPDVTNDKFELGAPLAVQSDGSIWLFDAPTERLLHVSSAGAYLGKVMYHINGTLTVSPQDPTRLFYGWLEYKIDYTKPLLPGDADPAVGGNGSWTLVKYWGAGLENTGYINAGGAGLNAVATLRNGRTYALTASPPPGTQHNILLELSRSGNARDTGIVLDNFYSNSGLLSYSLNPDGSLRYGVVTNDLQPNGMQSIYQESLTGFDSLGNPKWGSPTLLATMSATSLDPAPARNWPGYCPWHLPITDSDVVVTMAGSTVGGMALGGARVGTTGWLWKGSPVVGTDLPMDGLGSFDLGDGVNAFAGNNVNAFKRHVIYGYHGESWNASQANQFMHFYDDGLFVGQFGTTGDTTGLQDKQIGGRAGNSFCQAITESGNELYYYHNDESVHSGAHRWRVAGAKSIHELTGSITSNQSMAPTLVDDAHPVAPYGLAVHSGNASAILSWHAVDEAVAYDIRYANTAGVNTLRVSATAATVSGLQNGSPYRFSVSAAFSDGSASSKSEEVIAIPTDPAKHVYVAGQAGFLGSINTFKIETPMIAQGAAPTVLHTMFENLGDLSWTAFGTEGYYVTNSDGMGTPKYSLASGITVAPDASWRRNYTDPTQTSNWFNIDGVITPTAAFRAESTAEIKITAPDANQWYVLTVFSPTWAADSRHSTVTLYSTSTPSDAVAYTTEEDLFYSVIRGEAYIHGLNRIYQFVFKGNVTLNMQQLPSTFSDDANVSAVFFDKIQ